MFCENCGKKLSENAKFCSGCGTQTTKIMSGTTEETTPVEIEAPAAYTLKSCLSPIEDPAEVKAVLETTVEDMYLSEPAPQSRSKHNFLIFRCVCCFTTLFSILGPALAIALDEAGKMNAFLDIALLIVMLLGFVSTLFACPLRLLGVCGTIIITCFTIGLYFFGFGALIGGLVGISISIALIFFGSYFVSIPYFFTNLIHEI